MKRGQDAVEPTPGPAWTERGRDATAALRETWSSMAQVGLELDSGAWEQPTACPGWNVKDQFSHLIGIERLLLGEGAPEWDEALGEHVKNEFAMANEPWIAVRRSRPGAAVRDEFNEVTTLRLDVLNGLSDQEWAKVGPSPVGEVPYARFMVTRVFDSWVHEQDVRQATGRTGGSGGLASSMALDEVQSAMAFVVGKRAAPPEGSVVCFAVTGPPGDARRFALGIEGGRAGPVDAGQAATVTLTLSSIDFMRLGCGRTTAADVAAAGGVTVAGDPALGQSVLASMSFTI